MATDRDEGPPRGGASLRVIAGFKFVEAALLILAGLGAIGLVDAGRQHELVQWLDELSLREGRRLVSGLAGKAVHALGAMPLHRFVLIGVGCFVYAAVFVVEGVGLWLRKRWAEYLTIVVTASLLPFEVVELTKHVTPARVATLVINLAVVAYLIVHLVRHRARD